MSEFSALINTSTKNEENTSNKSDVINHDVVQKNEIPITTNTDTQDTQPDEQESNDMDDLFANSPTIKNNSDFLSLLNPPVPQKKVENPTTKPSSPIVQKETSEEIISNSMENLSLEEKKETLRDESEDLFPNAKDNFELNVRTVKPQEPVFQQTQQVVENHKPVQYNVPPTVQRNSYQDPFTRPMPKTNTLPPTKQPPFEYTRTGSEIPENTYSPVESRQRNIPPVNTQFQPKNVSPKPPTPTLNIKQPLKPMVPHGNVQEKPFQPFVPGREQQPKPFIPRQEVVQQRIPRGDINQYQPPIRQPFQPQPFNPHEKPFEFDEGETFEQHQYNNQHEDQYTNQHYVNQRHYGDQYIPRSYEEQPYYQPHQHQKPYYQQSPQPRSDMNQYQRPNQAFQEYRQNEEFISFSEFDPNMISNLFDKTKAQPIVSFGFGGKMVAMFPKKPQKLNVMDQTPSDNLPYMPGNIEVHNISHLNNDQISSLKRFPGPLNLNTRIEDINYFINQEKNRERSIDSYGTVDVKAIAKVQLWELLGLLASAPGMDEEDLIMSIKKILNSHKDEEDNWSNEGDSSTEYTGFIPLQKQPDEAQKDMLHIQKLLKDGHIEEGCNYAMNAKLWPHAMLLSSMIDKSTYQKVVTEFAKSVFADNSPMRTLYMMFAERDDLLFTSKQRNIQDPLLQAGNLTECWQDNLAIILANRTRGSGRVIEKLGDALWKDYGLVDSAHFAYLVADYCTQVSSIQNRVVLIGGDHRRDRRHFINPASIQRTEIFEYLKTKADPNFVLPSFQPYKLVYAYWLTEAGLTDKALQYIDAITKVVERTKQTYNYNQIFLQGLQNLAQRLQYTKPSTPTNEQKSSGSWFWQKLDYGINKIIHGDVPEDEPFENDDVTNQSQSTQQSQVQQTSQPEKDSSTESSGEKKGWFAWLPSFKFGPKRREPNLGKSLQGSYTYNEEYGVWVKEGEDPSKIRKHDNKPPPSTMPSNQPFNYVPRAKQFGTRSRYVDTFSSNSPPPQMEMQRPAMPIQPPKTFFVPKRVPETMEQPMQEQQYYSNVEESHPSPLNRGVNNSTEEDNRHYRPQPPPFQPQNHTRTSSTNW